MSLSYLYPFFCKVRPSCFVLVFFAWKGTECHKLPFPVISNLRWKTHWVAHRLLTSRHTHFQSTVFLCEQFKLHSYLSLENGFLYIFLVCQCLGVFLFFCIMESLWYSQTFSFFYHICRTEIGFQCPRKSLLQWPCNVVIWKEIKPYAVPVPVHLCDLTAILEAEGEILGSGMCKALCWVMAST